MLSISVFELLLMVAALPLLGGVIGYVIAADRGGRSAADDERIEALEQEVTEYKQGVTTHFQETADLLQQMTEQYRSLYAHMAQGAVSLCDAPEDHPRLEEFKRLGRALDEAAAEASGGDEAAPRAAEASSREA